MKTNDVMKMPQAYALIGENECMEITGGRSGGIVGLISYLFGGLDISFGSKKSQVSTETTATAAYASTGTSGRGVGATAVHSVVDTDSTGSFFNWTANFNLGDFFNRLLWFLG